MTRCGEELRGNLLQVSVNVSPKQLCDGSFVEMIITKIHQARVSPALLRIEITETAAIDDMIQFAKQLSRLRDFGVEVAIDDFGTGNTSLKYLTDLPVKVVKLDRSMVQRIGCCEKHRTVIQSLTSMSQSLGMKVVAEGVEDQTQASFLVGIGCDELQGFLYSRPVPETQIFNLLHAQPF